MLSKSYNIHSTILILSSNQFFETLSSQTLTSELMQGICIFIVECLQHLWQNTPPKLIRSVYLYDKSPLSLKYDLLLNYGK